MWPGGRIPYTIHSSIGLVPLRKGRVEAAIKELEDVSCVKFEDISGQLTNYATPPADYPDFL